MVTLRRMDTADLPLVESWLSEAHVARWFLDGSSITVEMADLARCVAGDDPTEVLLVLERDRPIGWCQWYRGDDYPDHADGVGTAPGELGIDYAIGDPTAVGRGVGTALVAELVRMLRAMGHTGGIVADPDVANPGSRRVLEKNGFELVDERPVASEPVDARMAIYRLPALPPDVDLTLSPVRS